MPKGIAGRLKLVLKDESAGRGIRGSVGIWIIGAAGTVWVIARVPPQIPLFYSRPWGEAQITEKTSLIWLAGALALLNSINFLLAARLWEKEKLLGQIVVWTTFLLNILWLLALLTVWIRVGV